MARASIVAVVDDDLSVCTGVRRLLLSAGLQSATFVSGVDFLHSLDEQGLRPDCVVLDLSMPVLDGLGVMARLTASGVRCPVIFISAQEQGEPQAQALAAGGFAYLQKPFAAQALLDAIDSALRSTES